MQLNGDVLLFFFSLLKYVGYIWNGSIMNSEVLWRMVLLYFSLIQHFFFFMYVFLCAFYFPLFMCPGKVRRWNPSHWMDLTVDVFNYFLLTDLCVKLFAARIMLFQCWNFHLCKNYEQIMNSWPCKHRSEKFLMCSPNICLLGWIVSLFLVCW